jgi:hypothetical protein
MLLMAKKGRNSGSSLVKTKAGHKVRSQSECRIDDWLFSQKLNYVYEPVFWMNGRKIEPDWVIMPGDYPAVVRPIVIEYWGLSYSPRQMKRKSHWVKNAQDKYAKRRKNKEEFYAEQKTYDYIGITPDHVSILKRWLPEQLARLGVVLELSPTVPTPKKLPKTRQKVGESVSSLTQSMDENQRTQHIRERLPDGWSYTPKRSGNSS